MTRPAIVIRTLELAAVLGCLGCSSDDPVKSPESGGSGGTPAGAGTGGTFGPSGAGGSNDAGTAGTPGAAASAGSDASGGNAGGSSGASGEAGSAGSSAEPYAHVVAVSASGSEQSLSFSVSVESADIDCTQFANWWEVLSEDGALLYRRILEHSHTDENGTTDEGKPGNTFTRSGGPVAVNADTVVLVRAHLNTGGYNGRVMRGSADAGFADAPDITAEFAADVEDDPPQSDRCDF